MQTCERKLALTLRPADMVGPPIWTPTQKIAHWVPLEGTKTNTIQTYFEGLILNCEWITWPCLCRDRRDTAAAGRGPAAHEDDRRHAAGRVGALHPGHLSPGSARARRALYALTRPAIRLLLMYACGLRISEAASLEVTALDKVNLVVCVIGKGNKERRVPVPQRRSTPCQQRILRRRRLPASPQTLTRGGRSYLHLSRDCHDRVTSARIIS
jgi:Phage integrase family